MASVPPLGRCALLLCILLSAHSPSCDAWRSQGIRASREDPLSQSSLLRQASGDRSEAFYEAQAQRSAELLGHEAIKKDHPYRIVHLSTAERLAEQGGGASGTAGDVLPSELLQRMAGLQDRGSRPVVPLKGSGNVRSILGPRRRLGESASRVTVNGQASGSSVGDPSEGANEGFQGGSGRQVCDSELRQRMRADLGDIVVVLNFNYRWVAEKTADFWRRVYSPVFKNIVFVGPDPWPELGVEARAPSPWGSKWKYQYWCLSKIMARYPNATGFLWTNDDVIVNYWKFLQADKTKLWMPNDPGSKETRRFKYDAVPVGQEESATVAGKATLRRAYEMLDESYRGQLDASSGEYKDFFQKRIVDLFYVPKRLVEAFAFDLMPVYREARAHSEAAIPTMFYAMEHPNDWDHVLDDMVYRWDLYDSRQWKREAYRPEEVWNPDIPALHPWKIGTAEAKKAFLRSLSKGDPCVCQDFADMC